jgi:hypothetical protein
MERKIALLITLLYLCILLFIKGFKDHNILYNRILLFFGMVLGFFGVVYGFYLFLTLEQRQIGIGVMSAWLMLELGALQLRQFYIKHSKHK